MISHCSESHVVSSGFNTNTANDLPKVLLIDTQKTIQTKTFQNSFDLALEQISDTKNEFSRSIIETAQENKESLIEIVEEIKLSEDRKIANCKESSSQSDQIDEPQQKSLT